VNLRFRVGEAGAFYDGVMTRVQRHGSAQLFDGGFPYSASVAPGSTLFTAGISPLGPDGTIPAGDAAAQTRLCLDHLRTVLAERGAVFADIAKLTVYVATTDRADLGAVWAVVDEAFAGDVPAAMMLGVTVLAYPGQLVELEAIAAG